MKKRFPLFLVVAYLFLPIHGFAETIITKNIKFDLIAEPAFTAKKVFLTFSIVASYWNNEGKLIKASKTCDRAFIGYPEGRLIGEIDSRAEMKARRPLEVQLADDQAVRAAYDHCKIVLDQYNFALQSGGVVIKIRRHKLVSISASQ